MSEEKKLQAIEAGGQTFIIDVKCAQNHTWQGTVSWVQKQKRIPFRSALELIKLIDSAVGTNEIDILEGWE